MAGNGKPESSVSAVGTANERRFEARDNVHLPLIATLLAVPDEPQIRIEARNLSANGLGFISRRTFVSGELFSVSLTLSNHSTRLILCRVCFCKAGEGGFQKIGAEFVEAIAANSAGKFPRRWIELAASAPQPGR